MYVSRSTNILVERLTLAPGYEEDMGGGYYEAR